MRTIILLIVLLALPDDMYAWGHDGHNLDSNKPLVIEQLVLAGQRLAAIINAITIGKPLSLPINW